MLLQVSQLVISHELQLNVAQLKFQQQTQHVQIRSERTRQTKRKSIITKIENLHLNWFNYILIMGPENY